MQWVFKVGYKKLVPDLTERLKYWSDCQLVDIRPTGFYPAKAGKHFCIIEDGLDYWKVRGDTNWKSTKTSVLELKKFLTVSDINGKYPWDDGYNEELLPSRKRDWFLDYKSLLDSKLIVADQFDQIYDKTREGIILLDRDIPALLSHEDAKTRLESPYSERTGTIASGTYTIGAAGDYATITLFEADIAAQLTGNLTGEHLNEETTISVDVYFSVDAQSYTLKLTAQSGAEHNGGAYGNGARIAQTSYDSIEISLIGDGGSEKGEISNMAFDISGVANVGPACGNNENGTILFNRLLVKGDSASSYGLAPASSVSEVEGTVHTRNCIVYGCSGSNGIFFRTQYNGGTYTFYNNTIIGCSVGIRQDSSTESKSPVKTLKNNLCQNNTTDYSDAGAGFGTTAKNVSEDATSPDVAYRSKDVHTNSVFKDYAANDYRLDSGGDATNLAILDDGEDLSGTFTDDIQGQTRSTWYIGASEIVSGGSTPVNTDRKLKYHLRHLINDVSKLKYAVRNLISDEAKLDYHIRDIASDERRLKYDVRSLINDEIKLDYTIRSLTSDEAKLKYNIRDLANDEIILKYSIANLINDILTAKYSIDGLSNFDGVPDIDALTNWDNLIWAIGQYWKAKYDIRNLINDEIALKYNIRNLINDEAVLKYGIRDIVNDVLAAMYAIGAPSDIKGRPLSVSDLINGSVFSPGITIIGAAASEEDKIDGSVYS
jgi:hypothetical protein